MFNKETNYHAQIPADVIKYFPGIKSLDQLITYELSKLKQLRNNGKHDSCTVKIGVHLVLVFNQSF